jgi:hypothetical protein
MLTRRCNMTCAHCSVQSGPKIREEPSDDELVSRVHAAADAGLRSVQITGGEPMLREKLVFRILSVARKRGLTSTLSSNGFWGRRQPAAWRKVGRLKRAGLSRITISYDRYHAEFQGPEPALHIARAAEWFDLPYNLNITRVANDPELESLVAPFQGREQLKMRFYDVQVVGRARELPLAEIRRETTGFCNACCTPAITDDGRMTACNGPAYFLGAESPLVIGSTRESPMQELIEKHTDDPILETIRRAGPARLLRELDDAGVRREIGVRAHHSGLCDLCIDINSNPAAVSFLRARLASQDHQAELAARRMVIASGAADRTLGLEWANGVGAARLWLDAARGRHARVDAIAERVVGRADYDWNRAARYLTACGVARGLESIVSRPSIARWAPSFFGEALSRGAVNEGLHELKQREVLRLLNDALDATWSDGVLLKGGAFLALESFDYLSGEVPPRTAGDIDVYIPAESAPRVRARLLETGFIGDASAPRTGPHHLAPVSHNGVSVEIHTSIMPAFWRLPELEMLSQTRSIAGLSSLSTLDAEGMLLHAMTHSSAHVFSRGLRAGWDAAWILERFPSIDVERLRDWISRCSMPRAFWVPAKVLGRGMVSLPQPLMEHAPHDERERRLERVAEARIFSALEGAYDLNPISKNGFFLLLHDSAAGKARHIVSLFGADERESRRSAAESARRRDPGTGHSALRIQLQEGMMHWRQFQKRIRA